MHGSGLVTTSIVLYMVVSQSDWIVNKNTPGFGYFTNAFELMKI